MIARSSMLSMFGVFALICAGSNAYAQDAADKAADLVSGELCTCFTCGIELGTPGPLTTFDSRAVGTSADTVTFQCHFDIPEGFEPNQSIQLTPLCNTPFGFANKTKIVLTPGGKAILTCQVNPSGE